MPTSLMSAATPMALQPGDKGKRDIATEAYEDALRYLEREFEGNSKALAWLRTVTSTSIQDVLATAQAAENKYDQAQGKNSAKAWLRRLTKRIMYYGRVLDVLAQHHPEYVSLVWGMVKFVLMGILNHSNLVEQFSQALSLIAQVLPRSEVSADLYRTDEMRHAVANLYAHILLFLKQAAKWYNVGPAGRVLQALFKPFELSYKDTVEQIRICSQNIDGIASLASKVEIREIKTLLQNTSIMLARHEQKLHDMQANFNTAQEELTARVGTVLQVTTCSSTRLNEVQFDMKQLKPRIVDMHFNHILDVLKPKRSPEDALQAHRSIIRRSSPWRSQNQNTVELFQSVGHWITSPQSSRLILQTQPRAQARVKEIATELIGILQPQYKQVIWYLSGISHNDEGGVSTIEILRSLVFQSMKLVPELVASDSSNFSTAKIHAVHSETEWLNLLCFVLQQLTACFIVIEAEDVFIYEEESKQFVELTQRLANRFQDTGTSIKLLFVNYSNDWPGSVTLGPQERIIVVNREAPVPPRRRRPGTRSVFRGASWSGIGRIS